MPFKLDDYFDRETFARIKTFADTMDTPFLVVDTATVSRQYDELVSGFPFAKVYYAVKAKSGTGPSSSWCATRAPTSTSPPSTNWTR